MSCNASRSETKCFFVDFRTSDANKYSKCLVWMYAINSECYKQIAFNVRDWKRCVFFSLTGVFAAHSKSNKLGFTNKTVGGKLVFHFCPPIDWLTLNFYFFLPINRDLCGFLISPRQHAPLSHSVYPHEPIINGESPWCTPCVWVALTFRSCDDVSAFISFFLRRGRALNSAGSEGSLDGDKVCAEQHSWLIKP